MSNTLLRARVAGMRYAKVKGAHEAPQSLDNARALSARDAAIALKHDRHRASRMTQHAPCRIAAFAKRVVRRATWVLTLHRVLPPGRNVRDLRALRERQQACAPACGHMQVSCQQARSSDKVIKFVVRHRITCLYTPLDPFRSKSSG